MRNEMMHRPVVKPELVAFMREKQNNYPANLVKSSKPLMKKKCQSSHMKLWSFAVFIGTASAKEILEIGTAIGFLQA